MTVIPFPQRPSTPAPLDPLESALLSAWNNSPDVMDDYSDEDVENAPAPGE
ncbi:hypothetical protein ABT275_35830 [Streptomyces sp. NPDC001185]|uniref:hypothetical protein n=1 Tax=Streptomyces sp. NPDC001185 TaxID=3154380 RepID=UPI00332A12CC